MLLKHFKIYRLLAAIAPLFIVSACAETRGAHLAPALAPAPPQLETLLESSGPQFAHADVDTAYEADLNAIEPAAGVSRVISVDQRAALSGCDYSDRFAEDKLGYRWGAQSNNRLGFGVGGASGFEYGGVKFGYSYTFQAAKKKRGC